MDEIQQSIARRATGASRGCELENEIEMKLSLISMELGRPDDDDDDVKERRES